MVTLAPVFLIRNVLLSVVTSRVLAAGDLDYVVSVSRTHRNVRIIVRNNKMPLSLFFFRFLATKTCQGVIYANNTYFVNQGYPASYTAAGQCYTTVNRLAPNICQLRYY